jgi:cytochrome c-type biogenesis protein
MKNPKRVLVLGGVTLLFIAIMAVGVTGWTRLVFPNLGRISQFPLPLLLGFSFLAGMVSFFAPCAFALFPGYIAFYLGTEGERGEHPAKLGIVASSGVISFFLLLSAVLITVGAGIVPYLRYLAPTIGLILIVLGLLLFSGYSFKAGWVQGALDRVRSEERRSKRNIYLFGFGYGAVSLGCTLPLLFALIIIPLTAGKVFPVFASLLVYAIAMSLLMVLVTYLVSWSENELIRKMVRSTGTVKKLSGLVLVLIGAFLVYYNLYYSMLV